MIEKLHFLMLRRIEIFSSTSQVSVEIPLASGFDIVCIDPVLQHSALQLLWLERNLKELMISVGQQDPKSQGQLYSQAN